VIIPLATFFSSAENNYNITPVLRKLLSSNIFYDSRNYGAIVKSPAELMIGMMRHFNFPVPDLTTESVPFRKMMEFQEWGMSTMQLRFLDQPLVFGSPPYYQTGYSKNWINGTTLGVRGQYTDAIVYPWLEIKPGYMLGIDFLTWIKSLQPNFSDVAGTQSLSIDEVFEKLTEHLFAIPLTVSQKNYLIDTVMMWGVPRTSWRFELNGFRSNPDDINAQNTILWRCQSLFRYCLRMAEYQVF
jgi:hypothetical protein